MFVIKDTAFIATLDYSNVEYQSLEGDTYVAVPSREALIQHTMESWKAGQVNSILSGRNSSDFDIFVCQLNSVRAPIKRCRALTGFTAGNVTLAVNGRAGRRVACVLDSTGTVMESFDLEGDVEDMEVADDGREQ